MVSLPFPHDITPLPPSYQYPFLTDPLSPLLCLPSHLGASDEALDQPRPIPHPSSLFPSLF
ncbi:unnamed protein product, partial [Closterium sp. Naga37s-1]